MGGVALLHFMQQMVTMMDVQFASGAADLGLVHGLLLSLRLILEDVNFGDVRLTQQPGAWRALIARILAHIHHTALVALKRFMQSGPGGQPVPHADGLMYGC